MRRKLGGVFLDKEGIVHLQLGSFCICNTSKHLFLPIARSDSVEQIISRNDCKLFGDLVVCTIYRLSRYIIPQANVTI